MISRASSSADGSIEIEDVIQGIVRLPMPARDRVELLRRFYDATEKIENGKCVIEGPFREELHRLFSERHRDIVEQRERRARLGRRNEREAALLDEQPLKPDEERELERIVSETRGDFDNLNTELEKFGRTLESEIEAEVSGSADAAGIAEARAQLSATDIVGKKDSASASDSDKPDFSMAA